MKKKIVFLIGSMGKGGAERVISVLANHYADLGWKVDIITLLDSKCDYVLNKNITLKSIFRENKKRIYQVPFWIYGIRGYLKKENPDKIVSFIARINILTIIASFGYLNRVTISERNDPKRDGRGRVIKILTELLYPLVNNIIFQTEQAKLCFSKRVQKKGTIIINPIEVKLIERKNKEKKIVSVGRLIEQKNHQLLIEAFSEVVRQYPNYKLYIYGSGRLKNILKEKIKYLGVEKSVFLSGEKENIHDEISNAEIFILSSDYEGLSNALLEALTIGLPCISTKCAGSIEVIKNYENGILIPVKSKEKLVKSIIELIENPDLSKKLSEKAKQMAIEYRKENILKKWEEII